MDLSACIWRVSGIRLRPYRQYPPPWWSQWSLFRKYPPVSALVKTLPLHTGHRFQWQWIPACLRLPPALLRSPWPFLIRMQKCLQIQTPLLLRFSALPVHDRLLLQWLWLVLRYAEKADRRALLWAKPPESAYLWTSPFRHLDECHLSFSLFAYFVSFWFPFFFLDTLWIVG